jgi:two-component system sensor histidine kinase YesM
MKKIKFTLFYKILFIFLILIVPLYLSSFTLTVKMRGKIKDEMKASSLVKAQMFLDTFEGDLSNCMILQSRIMQNRAIKKLKQKARDFDVEKIRLMLELQEDIRQLYDGSRYIEEAVVYVEAIHKSISNGSIRDFSDEEYAKILEQFTRIRSYPFIRVGEEYYCVQTPYYSFDMKPEGYKPSAVFLLRINRKTIERELAEYFNLEDGGAFLTSYETNTGIHSITAQNALVYQVIRDSGKEPTGTSSAFSIRNKNKVLHIQSCSSGVLNTKLYVYQAEDTMYSSLAQYTNYLLLVSLALLISVSLFSVWIRQIVVTPINKLIKAFAGLDQKNTKIEVKYHKNDEFKYIYDQFNELFARLRHLIKQVYEEKLRSGQSEMKQLQYQIAPHFLYNCLFTINRLAITGDMDAVTAFSRHLGNYYQFITRSGKQEIALSVELEHLNEYISIQRVRFGNRITVEQDTAPELFETIPVPKLILQPIVENAYLHGLKNKVRDGLIRIRYEISGETIAVHIEDNGDELTGDGLSEISSRIKNTKTINETTGLINIHRRLQIYYGEEYGLEIVRSELGGMCATLRIPVKATKNTEGGTVDD